MIPIQNPIDLGFLARYHLKILNANLHALLMVFLGYKQRINKLLTVLWLWHLCRNRLRWARQQRIRRINTEWKDIKFHKSNHTAVTRRNHQNTIIICVCVSWYGDDSYAFIACHRI